MISKKQAPLAFAVVFVLLALYGLFTGSTLLKNIVLVVAILVGCLAILVATRKRANAGFWIMNTFNGWMCPTMFRCLDHVLKRATKGDPDSVVKEMDNFCWSGDFLMNIGDVKGAAIDEAFTVHKPKVMMELGAHSGYSTVRFAAKLPKGGVLHSVEPDPMGHATGRALLHFAGIADRVVSEYGFSTDVISRLAKEGKKVDFLFIDHVKHLYLSDLKLAIEGKLLKSGALVVADNVMTPGAPAYREWMLGPEGQKLFKTEVKRLGMGYGSKREDELLISVYLG